MARLRKLSNTTPAAVISCKALSSCSLYLPYIYLGLLDRLACEKPFDIAEGQYN